MQVFPPQNFWREESCASWTNCPKNWSPNIALNIYVSNCFWGHPVLYFLLLFVLKLNRIERKGRQEPGGSNEKVVKGEIDPSETFPNKNDPPCQEINGATEKWVQFYQQNTFVTNDETKRKSEKHSIFSLDFCLCIIRSKGMGTLFRMEFEFHIVLLSLLSMFG